MIFELLFPVKTFQLLRGRKILCKQSGVRAVNGLHLLIQGNPIICMCASVSPGVPVLHLFGITIKWEVPSFAVSSPYHPPSSLQSPCSLLLSADVRLPAMSWTGSCQSTVAPGCFPAEHFHPAKDFHWQVSVARCQNPSSESRFHKNPHLSCVSHSWLQPQSISLSQGSKWNRSTGLLVPLLIVSSLGGQMA